MNNLSEFENIIKGKVDSFEYPYDDAAWKKFKKSVPGKTNYWGYAALFSVVAVTVISLVYYFNNDNSAGLCIKNLLNNKADNSIAVNNQDDAQQVNAVSNNTAEEITSNSTIVNAIDKEYVNSTVNADENKNLNNQVSVENINPVTNNTIVASKPVKPNATFICDKKEGCIPLTVKFIPSEISDSIIYSWDFGDGSISTDRTPVHVYRQDGNFSVTLIVKYFRSEAVVTNKLQNLVKVFEQPVAQFNWTSNENSFGFENLSLGANKFKWVFPDTTTNEENVIREFKVTGKYPVQLIAVNKYGCTDIFSKEINVQINLPYQLANSFTPDGDGGNDFFGPQVVDNDSYYCEFQIFNKYGKLIFEAKGTPNDVKWNGFDKSTNKLANPDIYFYDLKIKDKAGNKDHKNGKLTVKK